MGVNKVVFGEKVIMDTTEATVTPQTMVKGVKALGANGEMLTGTLNTSPLYNNLDQTNEGYALDARQGKILDDKISEKLNKNYSSLTTLPSELTIGDKLLVNRLNDTYIINYEDLSSKIISEITPANIGALPVSGGTTSGNIIVGPAGTTRQAHSTVTSAAGELFMYSDGTRNTQGLYSIMNGVHREPVRINSDGSVVLNGLLAASNITGVLDITKGGTNATTTEGARENIGIYSSYIPGVNEIFNANSTITTMNALVQYVFDTYLLPKSKIIECCTCWAVTKADDSRCVGANVDLGTIYNNLTGGRPSYGILTFERVPYEKRIVVTFTPLAGGSASISKCPQIYATYGAHDDGWATGKKMENASGWYIKGSTRVKGNAETSYRWGDVNITPANIGAATNIKLLSNANTPDLIYAELSKIPVYETATIHVNTTPFHELTGKTGVYTSGTVYRGSTNDFWFNLMTLAGNASYGFKVTVSSTNITPGTVYVYNGTVMS